MKSWWRSYGATAHPDAVGEACRRLMDDEDEAERLGTAASERAAEYTWERTLPRLLGY